MPNGKLSLLQERVLVALADLEPRWTLTGGGSLAGFYTQHRETRDVDLFFRGQHRLGDLAAAARQRLQSAQLDVSVLRTSSTFAQLADTPHQLLVNKLCALRSRSELRDLLDVRELLAAG